MATAPALWVKVPAVEPMATFIPVNPNADFNNGMELTPVPPFWTATVPVMVDARILVFKEVMLAVLEATFVFNVLIEVVLDVILFVADVILVSKVAMVDEFTPPTVFTVGDAAVPLKSPANWIIPFAVVDASVGA